MSDIFLSYKREDQPTAGLFADVLERQGWSVWWDPKLRAGERFDDVIERALQDARCVIVLWSKRSVESQYVRDEATYALEKDKLVPVATDDARLPFRFQRIQTVTLIDWNGSDDSSDFKALLRDLMARLGAPPSARVKLTLHGLPFETTLSELKQALEEQTGEPLSIEHETYLASLESANKKYPVGIEQSHERKFLRPLRNSGLILTRPRNAFLQEATEIELSALGRLYLRAKRAAPKSDT